MSSAINITPRLLYQVDFNVQSNGKIIGATKRQVTFRFGFADPEALANGCVGVNCRGEEHEVVCIWSVASGKETVMLDGKVIHHVEQPKSGGFQDKMERNFNFGKRHVLKVVAHASAPTAGAKNMDGSEQRQFDLLLDGISFFKFSKLFELGCGEEKAIMKQYSSNTRGPKQVPDLIDLF